MDKQEKYFNVITKGLGYLKARRRRKHRPHQPVVSKEREPQVEIYLIEVPSDHGDTRCFWWKIDYYDADRTTHVQTIMQPCEY